MKNEQNKCFTGDNFSSGIKVYGDFFTRYLVCGTLNIISA